LASHRGTLLHATQEGAILLPTPRCRGLINSLSDCQRDAFGRNASGGGRWRPASAARSDRLDAPRAWPRPLDVADEGAHPAPEGGPGPLEVADEGAQAAREGRRRDAGSEPVLGGGLEPARALEGASATSCSRPCEPAPVGPPAAPPSRAGPPAAPPSRAGPA